MISQPKIKTRVRLIIIKNNKLLLTYYKDGNYHYYIGGKMEYGETVEQACKREVKEECHANFTFKKILYLRDFLIPEKGEHSLELYIWGDIDKYEDLEGFLDPEDPGNHWLTWIELNKLKEIAIKPKSLTDQLLKDYKSGFKIGARYLGEMDKGL